MKRLVIYVQSVFVLIVFMGFYSVSARFEQRYSVIKNRTDLVQKLKQGKRFILFFYDSSVVPDNSRLDRIVDLFRDASVSDRIGYRVNFMEIDVADHPSLREYVQDMKIGDMPSFILFERVRMMAMPIRDAHTKKHVQLLEEKIATMQHIINFVNASFIDPDRGYDYTSEDDDSASAIDSFGIGSGLRRYPHGDPYYYTTSPFFGLGRGRQALPHSQWR